MKKITIVLSVFLVVVACKKKKDETQEPTPAPTPVPQQISVKINGTEKHCSGCFSSSNSGGLKGSYFYLDGFNENVYVDYGTISGPGTYNLTKSNNVVNLVYIKNDVYYRAVNGTFNVTKLDSSSKGVINTLVGSFNFQTDTVSGTHFEITEGSVNVTSN